MRVLPHVLAFGLLASAAPPAFAHATAGTAGAKAGDPFTLFLTVPHGCDGKPTIEVVVGIPEGFLAAEPLPVAGWTATSETGPYERPYHHEGRPYTEGAAEIAWTGGSLPDAETGVFAVKGIFAEDFDRERAHFPLLQVCPGGEEAWIDTDDEGDRPAPHVDIVP